jgi:dolichyl-phosphate beta-glucosyltransferase
MVIWCFSFYDWAFDCPDCLYGLIALKRNKVKISVIIPTYNEETLIQDTIERTSSFLQQHYDSFEMIIADDGSSDSTLNIVHALARKNAHIKVLPSTQNHGKGYVVRRGMLQAQGEYALFMDADLSTPLDEIPNLIDGMNRNNADIGIGSRALKQSRLIKPQRFLRQTMGRTFNLLFQLVLVRGIDDSQCGFKCFRKEISRSVFAKTFISGFCFDAEILFIAKKKGFSIFELPVKWINCEDSRVNIISGSTQMFVDIFNIRLNDALGRYQ